MPGFGKPPIFKGTIANGATQYVGLPIHDRAIGAHIAWLDGTSSATITLELSSFSVNDAPIEEAGSAWEWLSSGVSITGPSAAGSGGGTPINVENVNQKRARLKIVAAAACNLEIHDGLT